MINGTYPYLYIQAISLLEKRMKQTWWTGVVLHHHSWLVRERCVLPPPASPSYRRLLFYFSVSYFAALTSWVTVLTELLPARCVCGGTTHIQREVGVGLGCVVWVSVVKRWRWLRKRVMKEFVVMWTLLMYVRLDRCIPYICLYAYIYIQIYIYLKWERERERGRSTDEMWCGRCNPLSVVIDG